MQHIELNVFPWNNPAARRDMGSPSDAGCVWFDGENAIGFHATSAENAAALIAGGKPKATAPAIGFDKRKGPAGFWVSAIPIIPYCVEIWMPHVDEEPVTFLKVLFKRDALNDAHVFEPTWPVPQFSIDPDDVVSIEELKPADLPLFRSPDALKKLKGYLAEAETDAAEKCRYRDAVLAAV